MEAYLELERRWAEFNEVDPTGMVACSSGTAALHLSLEALRLPPGSECICPDYTMIACPRAITMSGLRSRFVDCGPDLLMHPDSFEMGITDKTRAVMPVHIYGRRCWMDRMAEFADSSAQDIAVIEDLAEAHGVRPHRRTAVACWSFYRNKIVAGEEGGAVWFRDPEAAKLARSLRSMGFTEDHDFRHVPRGHNYRMSNVHAELVLKGLEAYPRNVYIRRHLEERLNDLCPPEWRMPPRDAPWVMDLRIPGLDRWKMTKIVKSLNVVGIAARHGFWPCSLQEEYATDPSPLFEATKAGHEVFYLPLHVSSLEAFPIIYRVLGSG